MRRLEMRRLEKMEVREDKAVREDKVRDEVS